MNSPYSKRPMFPLRYEALHIYEGRVIKLSAMHWVCANTGFAFQDGEQMDEAVQVLTKAKKTGKGAVVGESSADYIQEAQAEAVKITYDSPRSVGQMIEAKGDGFGIQITEQGLFVNGKTYPKGTEFLVQYGMVKPVKS